MRATVCRLAAVLALAAVPSLSHAQCCWTPIPQAPDWCNTRPLYYPGCVTNYGPIHCVYPPFPPYNGVIPGPPPGCRIGPNGQIVGPGGPIPGLPLTHPFARSPRDYFMVGD
jgi:hypothetical protein